jgi:hypothetical protein
MSDSLTDFKTSITTVLTSEDFRRAWPKLKSEIEAFCEDLSETGAFNLLNVLTDAASWALQHPPTDAADPPESRLPEANSSQATLTRRTEEVRIASKAEHAVRKHIKVLFTGVTRSALQTLITPRLFLSL